MKEEFNRDGQALEYGYVIQYPDGRILPHTFESNRRACWKHMHGEGDDWQKWKRDFWKDGYRCVPASRTISVEGAK